MKNILLIFALLLTLTLDAQVRYSTTKTVWNFRTSNVSGRKPITADFAVTNGRAYNTSDSTLYMTVNGVITAAYAYYPYSDAKPTVTIPTVLSNARYTTPKYQKYIRTSTLKNNIPLRADFTSPTIMCINWADSTIYERKAGVITKTFVIYPISSVPSQCVYTYSAWGTCQPNGTQTRTVISSSPSGCTGTPVLTQNCTYNPPTSYYGENNYYVSSSGNDSYTPTQAHSSLTPWRTIGKVNAYMSSLAPGDSVLFKSGETFYGTIIITKSGTSLNPIVFSSYGSGDKPKITGLETISGWSLESGSTYSKSITVQSTPNMLTLNGVNTPLGKFPASGYNIIDSHATNVSITDLDLNSAVTNWTGAELVIRKEHWVIDRCPITNHSGSTLYYTSSSAVNGKDNYGYFIQNDLKCLTETGNWAYKSGKIYMCFTGNNPTAYEVKLSTLDRLIQINGDYDYITINNLQLEGANKTAVYISYGDFITIQYCDIRFSGTNGVLGYVDSENIKVLNCNINQTNNDAIYLYDNCHSATIKNNSIQNSAMLTGMGSNMHVTHTAIVSKGHYCTIENNHIENTGYNAIAFQGINTTIKNNFINNYCSVLDDGAGIYTASNNHTGRVISNNIVMNGIGAGIGTADGMFSANGIYLDNNAGNVEVHNNTISDNVHAGITLHNAHENNIHDNTLYNNEMQINYVHDASGDLIRNNQLRRNIIASKSVNQILINQNSNLDDIMLFGPADSNYYINPFSDEAVSRYFYMASGKEFVGSNNYNRWRTEKDLHAKKILSSIPKYSLNSLIGSNKFSNGNFDSNITGTSLSYAGTATRSWDGTGKINGGTLKVSYTALSTQWNTANLIMNIGTIDSGKDYQLKFSCLGAANNKSIGVYLRQSTAPYTILTPIQYYDISTDIIDNTVLFSPQIGSSSALLYFVLNDVDGTAYIDNIELYETDVTISNPNDYILFEYNETSSNKTISLTGTWKNLDGTTVSGTVTLLPYTSIILTR